jgi:starvation-inducible DNA-binding protein
MFDMSTRPAAADHLQQAGADLQQTLVDLVDLSLQAKQLHWNVTGPLFKPLHQLLDDFTAEYREWSDTVAERLAAIQVAPDGRVATVGRDSQVEPLPAGRIADRDVPHMLYDRLSGVTSRARERMQRLGDLDLASQDVLIEIVRGLEKQKWMVDVERS